MSEISEDRRDKAMRYLLETDDTGAVAEGEVMRKAYMLELIKDRCFLIAEGNNEVRRAKANTSADVSKAHEEWLQAYVASKRIKSKRESERIVWETWRSENSNRRQGA